MSEPVINCIKNEQGSFSLKKIVDKLLRRKYEGIKFYMQR